MIRVQHHAYCRNNSHLFIRNLPRVSILLNLPQWWVVAYCPTILIVAIRVIIPQSNHWLGTKTTQKLAIGISRSQGLLKCLILCHIRQLTRVGRSKSRRKRVKQPVSWWTSWSLAVRGTSPTGHWWWGTSGDPDMAPRGLRGSELSMGNCHFLFLVRRLFHSRQTAAKTDPKCVRSRLSPAWWSLTWIELGDPNRLVERIAKLFLDYNTEIATLISMYLMPVGDMERVVFTIKRW